jgi:flavin reductase (DIM6/NTAB) family NADH-FMN oxidoreductase RutF
MQPASKVESALLCDAVANFECKLVTELETGDHVIFVGEVICSHVNTVRFNRLYTVGENLKMGGVSRS